MAQRGDTFDRLLIARAATVRLFEFHINSMIPLPSTGPWGGDTSASSVAAMAELPHSSAPSPVLRVQKPRALPLNWCFATDDGAS